MPEGRARPKADNSRWVYDYFLKDHLGNTRVVITDDYNVYSPILQANNYCPFGYKMEFIDWEATNVHNQNKYNGKELQEDLGLDQYDYGARFYDVQLGVWHNVDPLSDKMRRFSPYAYAFDNPMRFIDADGMAPEWIVGTDGKRVTYSTNSDGTLNWSKNASADVQRIGNALSQTQTGIEALNAAINSKDAISMKIDNEHIIDVGDGNTQFGGTKTMVKTITISSGKEEREFNGSTITIYARALDQRIMKPEYISYILGSGDEVQIKGLTLDDHIGAFAIHEIIHATDKKSSLSINPTEKYEDYEKKPYNRQVQYYQEIYKIRSLSSIKN